MKLLLADLRGGLAITRTTMVAVAVFVAFGTGVNLAFDALSASLLSNGSLELPMLPGFLSALIVASISAMIVPYILILFMIEIAALGADRCAGKDSRMQLVFKPNVALSLLVVSIFSVLIVMLLDWLLHSFVGVVLLSLLGSNANMDSGSMLSMQGFLWVLQHLLNLIVVAFGVSRFALVPVIARHYTVGFREAWHRQTTGFDNYYGSVRNRFFRVFLALLAVETAIAFAVTSIISDGVLANVSTIAISVLLLTVWPVAILTHMVRSQAAAPSPADDEMQDEPDTNTLGRDNDDDHSN